MPRIPEHIVHFFQRQGCVVVSTIDKNGFAHSSCKGIVKISKNGNVYLLDLYMAQTFQNLKRNPHISITAIDEHRFTGFCLKGKAKIVKPEKLSPQLLNDWEDRVNKRITQRIIKNMQGEKGHGRHPESLLPEPAYMIMLEVKEIVDLTPQHLK
ncbi:MAG: pyridoxamine 5'-phosphate oxidase family protein [Candidatus Omnitrophica bacterium]|nr:pyridoxamine 5'-phosphate oxidase family protein [Candidatus Omnitrophota bacterium]MDD5236563.1 pyridoxamine 5'-phosphate oxidase family protein [Candidatus Omnitrophota bacterium]MDD5610210.1 pyridoxamine 5'-phosphate oxidase family protein [Candidatus Omnitrophota bacterium]